MGESSFPILCIGFILKLFLDTFEGLFVVFYAGSICAVDGNVKNVEYE